MITNNTDKKALVEKLFTDKVITLDQMYMLLDEVEQPVPSFVQPIYIPQIPVYPIYPSVQPLWPAGTWPWGTICDVTTSTANPVTFTCCN